jgi:hypothetical protein
MTVQLAAGQAILMPLEKSCIHATNVQVRSTHAPEREQLTYDAGTSQLAATLKYLTERLGAAAAAAVAAAAAAAVDAPEGLRTSEASEIIRPGG